MKVFLAAVVLLLSSQSFAKCDYKMVIMSDSKGHQGTYNNLTLPLKDAQVLCLDVPDVKPINGFIEWSTINLANVQCSDLKMIVTNPKGEKLEKSYGSQPGTIGKYMPGRWKMKLKLRSGCNKYTFNASW